MNDLRAVVLLYHSMNVGSSEYSKNDHIAFAEDLRLVSSLGWTIVPLATVVDAYLQGAPELPARTLAITFDDGSDFDFRDLPHPAWGLQRGMLGIMQDFREETPHRQPTLHATSFVITSPEARQILDHTCMIGRQWWNDDWWSSAVNSGLMHVASHSWDHNHASLPAVRQREQRKDTFLSIDNIDDANAQIGESLRYIKRIAPNPAAALFAYPFGEASDFLRSEYFPDRLLNPGVTAAFGCKHELLTAQSDRWFLPRITCGDHWKSPEELAHILRDFAR